MRQVWMMRPVDRVTGLLQLMGILHANVPQKIEAAGEYQRTPRRNSMSCIPGELTRAIQRDFKLLSRTIRVH
ncbi:hypothetical protein FKP32DRAFT_1591913 [Trametes sanguinea]|nr:hypothetical protein FKP32DRAFT_1591913 [Trametes sanguinea]